jgi:hypothetical protein
LFLLFFTFPFNYFILLLQQHPIYGVITPIHGYVGKSDKPSTGIGTPTHTRVCFKVNTHTGTLDYLINGKHIKDRIVNVPKDVYFGV